MGAACPGVVVDDGHPGLRDEVVRVGRRYLADGDHGGITPGITLSGSGGDTLAGDVDTGNVGLTWLRLLPAGMAVLYAGALLQR